MPSYYAKKRLGQNFLKSKEIIDKLVEIINPQGDEKIIEIGPGRGTLTLPLASSGATIQAVEYDRDLIEYLKKLLSGYSNVQIINNDFLTYEPPFERYKLAGNLPFNITSPVIEWAIRHHHQITGAYFLVQREVAARLASSPGSKNWSPIAIFTQIYFDIRVHFDINPRHFQPPPKVTSSFIELISKKVADIKHYKQFEKVVRTGFKTRRKILINNIVPDILPDNALAHKLFIELNFDKHCRAEQLSTEHFLRLTNLLIEHNINI